MDDSPWVRVAKAARSLDGFARFYVDGLGFEPLASFVGHAGFDGVVFVDHRRRLQIEFTVARTGLEVAPLPRSGDDVLVLACGSVDSLATRVDRMKSLGFEPVVSTNPYWDHGGVTFADHEGNRVAVFCRDGPITRLPAERLPDALLVDGNPSRPGFSDQCRGTIVRGARELRIAYTTFKDAFRRLGREGCDAERRAWFEAERTLPRGFWPCVEAISLAAPWSIEYAICYLEVRPYYNHSQYHFKWLERAVRRCPVDPSRRERLDRVRAETIARRARRRP